MSHNKQSDDQKLNKILKAQEQTQKQIMHMRKEQQQDRRKLDSVIERQKKLNKYNTPYPKPDGWVPGEIIKKRMAEGRCKKCGLHVHKYETCAAKKYLPETEKPTKGKDKEEANDYNMEEVTIPLATQEQETTPFPEEEEIPLRVENANTEYHELFDRWLEIQSTVNNSLMDMGPSKEKEAFLGKWMDTQKDLNQRFIKMEINNTTINQVYDGMWKNGMIKEKIIPKPNEEIITDEEYLELIKYGYTPAPS
ncbi:hypothetical protein B0J17DRAFT_628722 [Rhizoctonia solani]|nr:hypothetical protein B0J17DRAFT_628722 [Rhizoctonia solani]